MILAGSSKEQGQEINPQKVQGSGTAVKFLGVLWSGKMHGIPGNVIAKIPQQIAPVSWDIGRHNVPSCPSYHP